MNIEDIDSDWNYGVRWFLIFNVKLHAFKSLKVPSSFKNSLNTSALLPILQQLPRGDRIKSKVRRPSERDKTVKTVKWSSKLQKHNALILASVAGRKNSVVPFISRATRDCGTHTVSTTFLEFPKQDRSNLSFFFLLPNKDINATEVCSTNPCHG